MRQAQVKLASSIKSFSFGRFVAFTNLLSRVVVLRRTRYRSHGTTAHFATNQLFLRHHQLSCVMCHKQIMPDKVMCKSPRSPYRRNRAASEQPVRPRLSRRITRSARVNLNSHWSSFEELSMEGGTIGPTSSRYSSLQDNEINENLVNELVELCRK